MEIQTIGRTLKLKLLDEYLDIANSAKFKSEAINAIDKKFTAVILNLSKVKKIDASGLGAIISVGLKVLATSGNKFVLCSIQKNIENSFHLSNIHSLFPIFSDETSAFDSLAHKKGVQAVIGYLGKEIDAIDLLSRFCTDKIEIRDCKTIDQLNVSELRALFIELQLLDSTLKDRLFAIKRKNQTEILIVVLVPKSTPISKLLELKKTWNISHAIELPLNETRAIYIINQLLHIPSKHENRIETKLFDQYSETTIEKLSSIERLLEASATTPLQQTIEDLRITVHKISGSSGSYGYNKAGEASKQMEQLLENAHLNKACERVLMVDLEKHFAEMRFYFNATFFSDTIHKSSALKPISQGSGLLISNDKSILGAFKQVTQSLHFELFVESDPNQSLNTLINLINQPEFIVIDRRFNESVSDGFDVLKSIKSIASSPHQKIGLLIDEDNLDDHMRATEEDVNYIAKKPLSLGSIECLLDKMISKQTERMPYKVLVVDDDIDVCHFLQEALEEINISVNFQNDERRILETLSKFRPDLLLLDINMPNYDGWTLLRTIRTDMRYNELKVIIITSTIDIENLRKSHDTMTFEEIWSKPLDKMKIQKRIYSFREHLPNQGAADYAPASFLPVKEFARMLDTIRFGSLEVTNNQFLILVGSTDYAKIAMLDQEIHREFLTSTENLLYQIIELPIVKGYLGDGLFAYLYTGVTKQTIEELLKKIDKESEYKIILNLPEKIIPTFSALGLDISDELIESRELIKRAVDVFRKKIIDNDQGFYILEPFQK